MEMVKLLLMRPKVLVVVAVNIYPVAPHDSNSCFKKPKFRARQGSILQNPFGLRASRTSHSDSLCSTGRFGLMMLLGPLFFWGKRFSPSASLVFTLFWQTRCTDSRLLRRVPVEFAVRAAPVLNISRNYLLQVANRSVDPGHTIGRCLLVISEVNGRTPHQQDRLWGHLRVRAAPEDIYHKSWAAKLRTQKEI